jgi:hypothetical protein
MDLRPNRPTSYPKGSMSAYLKRSLRRMVRLWILLFLFPLDVVWATSASISLSGSEGAITLNASASFSPYEKCDSWHCWTVNSGSLYVYRDGSIIGSTSGNGSASWSTTVDGGSLTQGQHTFTATAVDSAGSSSSHTQTITIDNTPVVMVFSPGSCKARSIS